MRRSTGSSCRVTSSCSVRRSTMPVTVERPTPRLRAISVLVAPLFLLTQMSALTWGIVRSTLSQARSRAGLKLWKSDPEQLRMRVMVATRSSMVEPLPRAHCSTRVNSFCGTNNTHGRIVVQVRTVRRDGPLDEELVQNQRLVLPVAPHDQARRLVRHAPGGDLLEIR